MFEKIMVPVDLDHADKLDKAIDVAARLAGLYGSTLSFVGVAGTMPSRLAGRPEEYDRLLADFAAEKGKAHGIGIAADPLHVHDPAADLDRALVKEADRLGADLIVMASHMPGRFASIIGSNGGYVAQHAKASVMVVR